MQNQRMWGEKNRNKVGFIGASGPAMGMGASV